MYITEHIPSHNKYPSHPSSHGPCELLTQNLRTSSLGMMPLRQTRRQECLQNHVTLPYRQLWFFQTHYLKSGSLESPYN